MIHEGDDEERWNNGDVKEDGMFKTNSDRLRTTCRLANYLYE
jgi:hypothetical protein